MARSSYFALCMLVLLQGFLPSARASAVPVPMSSVFSSTTAGTLAAVRSVSGTGTFSMSCSSTSVESYKSNSFAYAYSNSQANTQAYVSAAVKATTDALAFGVADSTGKCRSAADVTVLSAAATACASAMIGGRTSSLSHAFATKGATAMTSGCAYSSAYAYALVEGLAGAVAASLSSSTGSKCEAFTTTDGKAAVAAIARLTINGMASSWTSAYATGTRVSDSFAIAASNAIYSNDVSVYASAIASLYAFACSRCGSGTCSLCQDWLIPEGDYTSASTYGATSKGTVALASAFSEASARVCEKKIAVDTAVSGIVSAISNVCVQITAAAFAWAQAGGTACACAGSVTKSSVAALSATYGKVVSDAVAYAYKKDSCSAVAVGNIFAQANTKASIKVESIISAYVSGCTGKSSTTYSAMSSAIYSEVYSVYASAISDALSVAVTQCNCAGNCWCSYECSAGYVRQCPY